MSGSVREQVHGTLDVGFEEIGEQQVKNIARPIRAWRVTVGGMQAPKPGMRPLASMSRRPWRWVGALAVVASVAAAAIWATSRTTVRTTAAQLSTATTQVDEAAAGARDDMLVSRGRGQIASTLRAAEQARARTSPGSDAADLLARADALLWSENGSLAANREALKLVDEVLRRDPNDVAALVDRFWMLNAEYEEDLHADRDRIVREMDQATGRAVAVDPRSAEAWHARAITYGWQGRWGEAEAALAEARRLDPANPNYVEQRSHLLLITGRQQEISPLVDEVVKRIGSPGERVERDLCWVNLALAAYAVAIPSCERAMAFSSHPEYRRWEEGELFAGLRKAGIPER